MIKSIIKPLMVLAILVLGGLSAFAQQIKGTVYDTAKPEPMAGATVVVQSKNVATITDIDGKFTIQAKEGDVLLVQFMGYTDKTVTVGKAATYEIVMSPDSEQLSEVIVTALGLKREKRSLGYAATDVSGEMLNQTQSSNWLSGLQGKVAGVQFNSASSGPIGSQRVVVRGESSLSGNSGALFVVDGVPITSGSISKVAEPSTPIMMRTLTSVTVPLTSTLTMWSQSPSSRELLRQPSMVRVLETERSSSPLRVDVQPRA